MSFYETVTAAVNDMSEHGYDSATRLQDWERHIRAAAERDLTSPEELQRELSRFLKSEYDRLVSKGRIVERHPGVSSFTLKQIEPKLRSELDRRILASAQLIRLNRTSAIENTIRRFSGWATSIPPGGSTNVSKNETKKNIRKSLAQLPFEERRVIIDQGHKFNSQLNDLVATNGDAIAGVWRSNWRQKNYNYREDHKERDERIYLIRNSWALKKGLIKKDGYIYTDEQTMPAEEVFCRCHYEYIYDLDELPKEMLTFKGKNALAAANAALADL